MSRTRFRPGEVRVVEAEQAATVPCFRLPDLPGAALHRMLTTPDWAITHEKSGLAIRALLTERQARRLMRLLAGHNFDRPRDEVIRDEGLTADVLGYASQVCGEHLYVRRQDGSWTFSPG
ncbi:hypothetical protein [Deinococcus aluminii]|uniref:Uncharacterized protein n=1 Tax=Deinococcus aluminii TaxID=1656885 RepID=A0ABP9XEM1_9DEIO